jgi:hypothetical protein
MAQDLVVRYRAEVEEALRKIEAFANSIEQLAKESDKTTKAVDKTVEAVDDLGKGALAADKAIDNTAQAVEDLGKQADKAAAAIDKTGASVDDFSKDAQAIAKAIDKISNTVDNLSKESKVTAAAVDKIGNKVDELGKEAIVTAKSVDKVTNAVEELGKETKVTAKKVDEGKKSVDNFGKQGDDAFNKVKGSVKSFAVGAGAAIAAAFSVQAIVAFGKASVDAFLDAEKNAERLKFAITSIGGESEAAFDRLIDQSSKLQGITIFSDDSIQQAQAALSAFGLTADEIEKTIPLLADFATVTGTDIAQAAQQLGAGLEGAGREFKKYGIEVSATASRQQNLNNILNGFGKFAGSAEAASKTLSGQLAQQRNIIDDLQEQIGQKLAPAFIKIQQVTLRVISGIASVFGSKAQSNVDKTTEKLTGVRAEFNVLIDTLKRGNLTTEGRKTLIDEINTQYGEYLPNLLTEKSTLQEIEKAQLAVNKSIEQRILLVSLEAEIEQILKNTIAAQKDLIEVEKERIKLQKNTSDNAGLAASKQEQLNQRQDLANAIIEDGKKRIDDLKNSYAELAKQLGITGNAVGGFSQEFTKEQESAANLLRKLQIENIQDERVQREIQFQDEVNAIQVQGKLREDLIKELRVKLNRDLLAIDQKQTQDEKTELDKRDNAVLDSIEKQRLAEQKAADERAARKVEVDEIFREERITELLKLNIDKRIEAVNEFAKEETANFEKRKADILLTADIYDDANNKIIIDQAKTNAIIEEFAKRLGVVFKGVNQTRAQEWLDKNGEILQATSQLVGELSSLFSTITDRQIEDINREKDARLASIDEQLAANEEALSLRRISEQEAVRNEKALIAEKLKAEETAAKKERELKRKQAIADKAAALVQITIGTAVNVINAKNPLLIPFYIALGAAQAAIVAAQPIPYAKGTKNAKGGLSRVGEQGEEIMYVPNGTKVLPNKQTNRYGEVLDAMFDNRFDDFVNRKYIAPALMKEKARRETNQQKSFADNIVQSAMINPQSGLTYYDMEQLRKKGTRFEDESIEKLTDSLARKLSSSQSIYRS